MLGALTMKRDMDLIRQVLFRIEEAPPFNDMLSEQLVIDGYSCEAVTYHLVQLIKSGYLEGKILRMGDAIPPVCVINMITPEGHDFADAARGDTIWNAAKDRGKKVAGTLSLATMKALLIAEAARCLGLG